MFSPFRPGVLWLLAGAAILFWAPQEARCAGIYQDYSRIAYFLVAPAELAMEGRAAAVRAPGEDASIYSVTSLMPFRLFLFQLELPFVSIVTDDNIQDGFGDPAFRLRFNAWSGDDEALHVLMGVRAGSLPFLLSDDSLFPYSTGSLDFSFGLAFVDTVATAAWWVGAVATYPTRVEDSLDASGLYREFTQLTAGLRVPVWRFGVLAGATAYVPTGSATRQIYFADIDWRYSNAIGFFADVQAEGGPAESRVADYSFGLGTKINF